MPSEPVRIWTLALDETETAAWHAVLDPTEQARAARFKFARHRIEYVAAHALTRVALSKLADVAPPVWRFVPGANGKPVAYADGEPVGVSFNLSHADGMVGVAAAARPGLAIGFDIEPIDRRVELGVARRYFCPPEIAWLESQPTAEQAIGFLRLWTLKEAYIKATGEGLSADLSSFWFETTPPRLYFGNEISPDWHFEQQIVASNFIAAVGINHSPENRWIRMSAENLGKQALLF